MSDGIRECQALRDTTRALVEDKQDRDQLESRARSLQDRMREGDDEAAEAYQAVTEELDDLDDQIDEESANVCDYYRQNLVGDTDEFFSWLFDDVRTPDEIYTRAGRAGFCGYELLKEGMEEVELVVCNYHHLLDPTIREQFFRWLDRDPEQVVTVFDEAHNVADAARDHATRTLTENTLDSAIEELDETDDSRADPARNVLSAFADALRETYDDGLGFGGNANGSTTTGRTCRSPTTAAGTISRSRFSTGTRGVESARSVISRSSSESGSTSATRRRTRTGTPRRAGSVTCSTRRGSSPTGWTTAANSASIRWPPSGGTRAPRRCTAVRSCTPASRDR